MPSPLFLPLAPRWSALVLQPEPGGLAVVQLLRDDRPVAVVDDPLDVLGYLELLVTLAQR